MNSRETILNELNELSRLLAAINLLTTYEVPEGYFEELPEKILGLVREKEEGSIVLTEAKHNPYNVPQGYFEQMAETILKKVKATEAGSPEEEMETLSPFLSKLNKKVPYTVPAGYFEELAGNVTDGAKAIELVNEELENLSPLMNSLKEQNVYDVPKGYFDGLAETVLAAAKQQQSAKVVSMKWGPKVLRYAAAAVVTGLIVTAAWLYTNNTPVIKASEDTVAKETQNAVKKISDEELVKFIETEDNLVDEPATAITTNEEIDATDMKEMLADVSDEELQQYVEETTPENNNSITN
jgi:hypothetical protein